MADFRLPDIRQMYKDMAAPLIGQLVCHVCGRRQPCSTEQAATYLAKGWPRCCAYTMELVRKGKEPHPHG